MPKRQQETVDTFMEKLDHPFKAEVQAIREIIKDVHPNITEEIKWNAPSFSYLDYLVTFNLRPTHHVHMIFHNPNIASIESEILEDDYPDRRMAYFASMDEVKAKRDALEYVVNELVKVMDK